MTVTNGKKKNMSCAQLHTHSKILENLSCILRLYTHALSMALSVLMNCFGIFYLQEQMSFKNNHQIKL